MAGIYPDLYSRYRRGGRWRMAGDDVWYWRQYQRLQSAQFPGRRGGRDRGAGDFPPSATRLTAAKRKR